MKFALALATLACVAAPAHAATAVEHFRQGRFAAAADAARAERSAAGYALAARATLIRAAYEATAKPDALALVLQGERDADAALAIDPNHYDAMLQKAAAIGYRADLTKSRSRGGQARDILRALTKRAPERYPGWVALGAWHGEAIDTLGPMLGAAVLGASAKAMERDFAQAVARDPVSPVAPAYLGLLRLRMNIGEPRATRALLERAARLPARDGYEALLKRQAVDVLALVARGENRAARSRARALGPFGALG